MGDDSDEYDAYNLSEFSAADFAHIEAARQHDHDATAQAGMRVVTSESGGPQIAVALEPASDESVLVKDATSRSGSVEIVDTTLETGDSGSKARRNSPIKRYRSRKTLSVSDLVGPAWYVFIVPCSTQELNKRGLSAPRCEVQFDYGLRQGRSRTLAERPESFVSDKGKVIKVEKKVAVANERDLGRGRVGISLSSTFCIVLRIILLP